MRYNRLMSRSMTRYPCGSWTSGIAAEMEPMGIDINPRKISRPRPPRRDPRPMLVLAGAMSTLTFSGCALRPVVADSTDSQITVSTAHVMNSITPLMYGSCIEDVNHEIYGGLYDQRLF